MTNLSELLPSGGGAKEFSAVASGTLPSGQTVVLKADGKVEAVGITSQAIGSPVGWGGSDQSYYQDCVYDPDEEKVIINYMDNSNSSYGECIVGDVNPSNNSITFGTATIYNTTYTIAHTVGYDTVNKKAVVFFQDVNASSHGKARVGTVSGTSISFPGSIVTYNGGSTEETEVAFSPTLGSFLVMYKNNSSGARPTGTVGTVSGNSISFGSQTQFDTVNCSYNAIVWDSTYSKFYIFYTKNTVPLQFCYQVVSVSGTTITPGTRTPITLNGSTTAQVNNTNVTYDSVNQKLYIATVNASNSSYGVAMVATSDGSTLTFGAENFFAGNTTCYQLDVAWDSSAQKVVLSYASTSQYGYVIAGSVSGTTLTFGSAESFLNNITSYVTNCFDSVNERVVTVYQDNAAGYIGEAVVFQPESSNVSNFIGITSEAIANTATGKVNPQGGVATAQALNSGVAGTPVPATPINGNRNSLAYDSNSNRIALSYADGNNNEYGTCVVGQVDSANSSTTFGTAVVFNTASTNDALNATTFDSNSNKIVIAFRDTGNSNKGYARVGTIDPSDNSISFPSASVEFEAGAVRNIVSTFDSSTSRIVIAYEDEGNSEKGTAIVGQVSGNTISFGTAVVFNDADTQDIDIAYGGNKVVIVFEDVGNSKKNTAIVGTVDPSDNSITYGSEAVYDPTTASKLGNAIAYDVTAQKFVIAYCDTSDGESGKALTGTVSGTNITFGTVAQFATEVDLPVATYDSGFGQVIIAYGDNDNSRAATALGANVSGTDLTFTTALLVDGSTGYKGPLSLTYDSTANKTVTSYRDGGDTNKVDVTVFTVEGLGPFTVNSTYYVQNDGTLTTTSSTVTAGKAISTTQLILNGAS